MDEYQEKEKNYNLFNIKGYRHFFAQFGADRFEKRNNVNDTNIDIANVSSISLLVCEILSASGIIVNKNNAAKKGVQANSDK